MVTTTTYLCQVDESSRFGARTTTLVLFLTDGEEPQPVLANPDVVGFRAAGGTWYLTAWQPVGRMAFYAHHRAGPGRSESGLSEGDAADYLDI
jgi:hypothetical protein